ncbi:hypothetical protein QN277_024931 [Acacia crassicarpa]|uniref:Ninja-family protein n=1 Tax=Acacia crassicarpa TaxID=499986 RepID=A0AAE1K8F9_9FABA|nr:hypothetical protein QN277_024931 [Acacia crassicarpa]
MVELSEVGLKEEEVELDLVLSIGGSFRRSEKQPDSKLNGFELNPKEQRNQAWNEKPEAVAVMYPQTKREIQALRRLEARKKREEKQQNKRVVREPEPDFQQRLCKREKTDHQDGGSEYPNVNLNLNGGEKKLGASSVAVGSTASFQQPYAYVQLNNGYAYPCVVEERNAGQPAAACKGFRPFAGNGYGSDPNGERDSVGNKKAKSDGSSTICSSSVASDHPSSSHEGGGSSDSQSQSVQSLSEPNNQLNGSIRSPLPEQTASSHSAKSDHTIVQRNMEQPYLKAASESGKKEEPMKKPLPTPLCSAKPPRPQPHHLPHLLTKMPYVSTTGNGPNGKRVNGFLYRYNNSQVSIVCVCHGSTFSPAGFVQHAGGTTDISHPERHITVINPPAFG